MEWNTFQNVKNYINFSDYCTVQVFKFLLDRHLDAFMDHCLFHQSKSSPSDELFILPPSLHQITSILIWKPETDRLP